MGGVWLLDVVSRTAGAVTASARCAIGSAFARGGSEPVSPARARQAGRACIATSGGTAFAFYLITRRDFETCREEAQAKDSAVLKLLSGGRRGRRRERESKREGGRKEGTKVGRKSLPSKGWNCFVCKTRALNKFIKKKKNEEDEKLKNKIRHFVHISIFFYNYY